MTSLVRPAPPDQRQREHALNPSASILVQAPAGSGKTDLLTRRFLLLLGQVDEPAQIVAITFTKTAAAEMRHRILSELERAAVNEPPSGDEFSMEVLAHRALVRSRALGWDLLRMPAQLRISTIDSFCRELALQQPLLSGIGGGLDIAENPGELYHRAARQTLAQIGNEGLLDAALSPAIESLLMWRDNGWQEMETQLVNMLQQRDRWMHDFVLASDPDWNTLRERLERPFIRAVEQALNEISQLLDLLPGACDEVLELARFACAQSRNTLHRELAEMAELPCAPFVDVVALESALQAYLCLAKFLLTDGGTFRKRPNISHGFPPDRKGQKEKFAVLINRLKTVPSLESKLHGLGGLPTVRYTDDDWQIVLACFTMLRHAAGQLRSEFAEAGVVDFIEVAQLAQSVLVGEDQFPSDAALTIADGIHHLLVDEFQDTSRRQHKLIASLVAAWPDNFGRTIFVVGDPMQSIYFFRDADAELFPRVRTIGLELPDHEKLKLDYVPLSSNFRTTPDLVETLNATFAQIFAVNDGSGVKFSKATAARTAAPHPGPRYRVHLDFIPQTARGIATSPDAKKRKEAITQQRESAHKKQTAEIIALIRGHEENIEAARAGGDKYRIAVLGRTRAALEPIARALREEQIPFRAVDLEKLSDRPEVLDALALARALFNPEDRIAWLGTLRAPWCGLSLEDLHRLTSADDPETMRRPIPALLAERVQLLSDHGQQAARRIVNAVTAVPALRAGQPATSLGTWLEQVWLRLGGASCVDSNGRANLDLLWNCLDNLQGGEPDLLGRGLDTALESLTAQPDPAADSSYGVQLMTIHKSKGLEFEVVIVPELHAGSGRGRGGLLSWLERGLSGDDESGDITEFLVAPIQSKGSDSGKTRTWVNRVYRERESQETRRILYVAATRARDALHLFARPEYKTEKDGSFTLCEPSGSLLSTAWPALAGEVGSRFNAWNPTAGSAVVESLAASAGSNLLEMPVHGRPAVLRRLPINYEITEVESRVASPAENEITGLGPSRLYERHEGGLLSRALGSAVHALLEEIARLRMTRARLAVVSAVPVLSPRILARLRALGIAPDQAAKLAAQAIDIALKAAQEPVADWILSPHPAAASEVRWAGIINNAAREVRVDRVFRAGSEPLTSGATHWWIIDYKTTHTDNADPAAALLELRKQFEPQLKIYAEVLHKLHGSETPICAGLYYPRMLAFDWWEI